MTHPEPYTARTVRLLFGVAVPALYFALILVAWGAVS